jgi:hypothetical protein
MTSGCVLLWVSLEKPLDAGQHEIHATIYYENQHTDLLYKGRELGKGNVGQTGILFSHVILRMRQFPSLPFYIHSAPTYGVHLIACVGK